MARNAPKLPHGWTLGNVENLFCANGSASKMENVRALTGAVDFGVRYLSPNLVEALPAALDHLESWYGEADPASKPSSGSPAAARTCWTPPGPSQTSSATEPPSTPAATSPTTCLPPSTPEGDPVPEEKKRSKMFAVRIVTRNSLLEEKGEFTPGYFVRESYNERPTFDVVFHPAEATFYHHHHMARDAIAEREKAFVRTTFEVVPFFDDNYVAGMLETLVDYVKWLGPHFWSDKVEDRRVYRVRRFLQDLKENSGYLE